MNPSPAPDWIASPLANLDDVMIAVDEQGRILSMNEEAEALSGLSAREAVGKPVEEVFPLHDEFSGGPPTALTRSVVVPVQSGELRAFDLIVAPGLTGPGWTLLLRPAIGSGDVENEAWANLAKEAKEGTGLGDPQTGTLGLVGDTFAALYGYTPREMMGMPLSLLFPKDGGETLRRFESYLRSGAVSFESRHLRKDGTLIDVLMAVTTVRDPLGQERFCAIRVENVSERKAAEELAEAQRRLVTRVVGLVPSIVYLIDLTEGQMHFLSRGIAAALGYHSESGPVPEIEVLAARFTSESLHPDDQPRMLTHRWRLAALADGDVTAFEYRIRDADGRWRWFLSRDTVFERDAEGRVRTILGAATDVTDLKRMSEELRETEAMRDLAASAASMAAWWWNFETGEVRVWNDEGRIYGLLSSGGPGEVSKTTIPGLLERVDALDRSRMEGAARRTMKEGVDFEEEVRVLGSDEVRWILAKGRRVTDAEGKPTVLAGVSIDITARKAAEEAFRESEIHMQRLVDAAKDYAIFTMDLDRRITSWNTGAAAIFGWSEEILGRFVDILFTSEDREADQPTKESQTALAEGRAADERWHVRKDGTRFYASGVNTPLIRDGAPYGFVKIARDLTDRRSAVDTLRAVVEADEQHRLALAQALRALEETPML